MKLDYNIYLELAAFPIDAIICVYLFMRYKEKTKVNLAFRRMAIFFTLADGFDVATAIVSSAHTRIPNWLHMLFNTTDSALAVVATASFTYYVYAYVDSEEKQSRIRTVINNIIIAVDYILLFQNFFTGNVFSYDAGGNYIHGPLFTLVAYLFPAFFLLNGCFFLLLHHKNYKVSQLITLAIGVLFAVSFFAIQMIFFDDWLITFFMASLGLMVMLFTLETPDYPELKRTIEQLEIARKQAEDARRQAQEASGAKGRFLTQASHEIRTPLNAILGYNDLVLKESEDEAVLTHAKKVRSSAERLWKFFTELLDFVDSENREEKGGVRRISPANGFLRPGAVIKGSTRSKGRVLVVDDNELNLDLMKHFIGDGAAEVVTAMNGAEAVAAVKQDHFDLIFMDNMMPVMDGVTAFRQMREEELCNGTPVVIVTANALGTDRERFLLEGFDAFLAKPCTENDVQTLLRRYLNASDENDEKEPEEVPEQGYLSQEEYETAYAGFAENVAARADAIEKDIADGAYEDARLRLYALLYTAKKLKIEPLSSATYELMECSDNSLAKESVPLLKLLRTFGNRAEGKTDAV